MQSLLFAEKNDCRIFHISASCEDEWADSYQWRRNQWWDVFKVYLIQCLQLCREWNQRESHIRLFYEFLFAMAMTAFADSGVEYIILETGIGGRLDATNAIDKPFLTIITSISLDHAEILGETIEQIAAEKAGIIKQECASDLYRKKRKRVAKVITRVCRKGRSACRETLEKLRTKFWKSRVKILHFQLQMRIMRIVFGNLIQKHFIRWKMQCSHWKQCSIL